MNTRKQSEEEAICQDIIQYGKEILTSDVFRQTACQTHHLQSTVMEHTMNVCIIAVKLCREKMRKGAQLNEKDLIQAALCHDLGMIGREKKYRHVVDTWMSHPAESAKIARKIVPDLSPDAEQMILTLPAQIVQRVDGDGPCLSFHSAASPGDIVELLSVELDGTVHGRDLLDRAGEARKHSAHVLLGR